MVRVRMMMRGVVAWIALHIFRFFGREKERV